MENKKKIDPRNLSWRNAHGLAGLVFLASCLLETVCFAMRGRPTVPLTMLIGLSSIPFGLGLFTPHFRRRLARLANRRFVFLRATAWIYAYLALAFSVYAQPTFNPAQASPLAWSATAAFAVFTSLAIGIAIYELRKLTIFTDGFLVANVTADAMLLGMPLVHLILGNEGLSALYEEHSIGHMVYILCVYTGLIAASDTFVLGQVTSLRAYYEQYKKSSAILRSGFYMTGSFLMISLLVSWVTGAVYLGLVTLLFAACSRVHFPVVENQKGLLGRE